MNKFAVKTEKESDSLQKREIFAETLRKRKKHEIISLKREKLSLTSKNATDLHKALIISPDFYQPALNAKFENLKLKTV